MGLALPAAGGKVWGAGEAPGRLGVGDGDSVGAGEGVGDGEGTGVGDGDDTSVGGVIMPNGGVESDAGGKPAGEGLAMGVVSGGNGGKIEGDNHGG